MSGTLFVVATPIGNLEDLTLRALRTLKEVDVIAAEDTRRTSKLLAHYKVRTSMVSLHEHNEYKETPRIIARLQQGETFALVSDAGTPGIADPGSRLVAAAHAAGLTVVPVPGPSAVTAALSASGFPASQFVFLGFPPRSGTAREDWLAEIEADPRTLVFYEAPHRMRQTLDDVRRYSVTRQIMICREMTKIHEQLVIQPITCQERQPQAADVKGEFVVVLGPVLSSADDAPSAAKIVDVFGHLTAIAGVSPESAIRMAAAELRLHPRVVRKAIKQHLLSVKRQSQDSSS